MFGGYTLAALNRGFGTAETQMFIEASLILKGAPIANFSCASMK